MLKTETRPPTPETGCGARLGQNAPSIQSNLIAPKPAIQEPLDQLRAVATEMVRA